VNDIVLASPAKINLFSRSSADGRTVVREIESIMQLVDLCDEVHLRRRRTASACR
jgi:4-diphosphocytidyl-2C-methyl-D-erythritol kinase